MTDILERLKLFNEIQTQINSYNIQQIIYLSIIK